MGQSEVVRSPFGRMPDGREVELFELRNGHGVEVRVITYGGIVASLRTPDRSGRLDDIVLGHDALGAYVDRPGYFGPLIGRYANRIARGRFVLDGVEYRLAANNGANHLHGGARGFDKAVWDAEPLRSEAGVGVRLRHRSPDGDEGYPGTVDVEVAYTLTGRDTLVFDYTARTDRPTPVNLTHHSYFNLGGGAARDVLDHVFTIHADRFTPTDGGLIPTGELAPVKGTPFDFCAPSTLGARIGEDDDQLRHGVGYDHNFVLNRSGDGLVLAAHVLEPASGRTLHLFTTEPGLQLYTGNRLDGTVIGKGGRAYAKHYGFCLEPQHFPDSPNRPEFPSTVLRPGETYRSQTVLAFGVTP